jgi:hypothetical protein
MTVHETLKLLPQLRAPHCNPTTIGRRRLVVVRSLLAMDAQLIAGDSRVRRLTAKDTASAEDWNHFGYPWAAAARGWELR